MLTDATTMKNADETASEQSWVGFVCRDCGAPLAVHRSNNGSRSGERSTRGWRCFDLRIRGARSGGARHFAGPEEKQVVGGRRLLARRNGEAPRDVDLHGAEVRRNGGAHDERADEEFGMRLRRQEHLRARRRGNADGQRQGEHDGGGP